MKITDLQVHDGYIVARLQGLSPFTVKLDGWAKSRPATEFSFFPESGWIVLGSTEKPLREGDRTLTATDALDSHTMPFYMGTPPPKPWNTVRIVKPGDWSKPPLIEGFKNATITTEPIDRLRFTVPSSGPSGSRCEVQSYFGEEGMICAYEWPFLIPAWVNLRALRSAYSLIHQGHGNERAGFTSGTKINNADDRIGVSVKGGEELSTQGSHRYESELEFFFDTIKRDVWHTVRHEVYWHRSKGWYRARLDNGPWAGIEDVPTWPIGNKDGVLTEEIMVRYGFYPQWGEVPPGGLEMACGPMLFQEQAA